MNKIFDKVNNCLEKFIGGEIFFDELDKQIKFDKQLLTTLFNKAMNENAEVIASGEIGLCLHNYGFPVDIIVQGGLRKGKEILDLSPFIQTNKNYVFIDDSYFSGKTVQVVKEEIERCGGKLKCVWVAYDGSQAPIHEVKSLYRYYDNFDILGRKIK